MATADRLERDAQRRNPWPYLDKVLADTKKADELISPYEDMRGDTAVEAAGLDYIDTNRELNKKAMRADEAQAKGAQYGGSMYDYYAEENNYSPGQTFLETQKMLTANWQSLENPRNLDDLNVWAQILAQAEDAGLEVSKDDVSNMIDWRKVNLASDRMAKLILEDPNKNAIAVENIAKTLQAEDPIYAGIAFELATEKVTATAKDPSIVDKGVAGALWVLQKVMTPFMIANEEIMQSIRGGMISVYDAVDAPGGQGALGNIGSFAYGATGGRSAAEKGKYNEEYIDSLYEATDENGQRLYSDKEIQVAFDLHRKAVDDPDFDIWESWVEYANDLEAQAVIGGIIGTRGLRTTQLAELMRQIDSAHLGNTGQVMFGAAGDEYSEARGGETRQDVANVVGFGSSILFDPTIASSKVYRGVQAARYALAALAPVPTGMVGARSLLRIGKGIGPIRLNNKTYRYFNALASDLNKYDELAKAFNEAPVGTAAQVQARLALDGARQRMQRQYGELPDDLIEDMIDTVPRNADGKIGVDEIADFIDDKNMDFVQSYAAVEAQAIQAGVTVNELPRFVMAALDQMGKESFDSALRRGGQIKRGDMAPMRTSAGAVRSDLANLVAAHLMPTGRAAKIMQKYVDTTNAGTIAQSMSDNATEIGEAVGDYKRGAGSVDGLIVTGEGLFDSLGRMFSSIAVDEVIDLTTGQGAKGVYRYARMFLPRKMAETVAAAYRQGDIGERRLLMSAVVRAAAQSRGISVSKKQADKWLETSSEKIKVTGRREAELYGQEMTEATRPSRALAESQMQTVADDAAEEAAEAAAEAARGIPIEYSGFRTLSEIVNDKADEIEALKGSLSPEEFNARLPQIVADIKREWREQVSTDTPLVEEFYATNFRYADEIPQDAPNPKDWYLENVPENGSPETPRLPSEVGGTLGVDARFINDGTISLTTLSNIADDQGLDNMIAWLYTGLPDNAGQLGRSNVELPINMPGRKIDPKTGKPIAGWKGVPEDWYMDFAVGQKRGKQPRIAVPWARGGAKARKEQQELDADLGLTDDEWLEFEQALIRGELDDRLEEFMLAKREAADPGSRFAPPPARKITRGEFSEPAPIPFVTAEEAAARVSLSADDAGTQSALHMDQTTDKMRLPTLTDFEDLRKEMGGLGQAMFYGSRGLERFTNFWSIATLFGWRFSIRNAIEEWGLWFLTAGKTTDLIKGRMTSTARRRASRELYVKKNLDGEYVVAWKPTQGLIGRTVEKARGRMGGGKTQAAWQDEWSEARGFPGFFMRNIIIPVLAPRVSTEALQDALVRYAAGDQEPWRKMVMEGLIGYRMGGRSMGSMGLMNDDDLLIVDQVLGSAHGMALLDDVAQSATYLNSARNPVGMKAGRMALDEIDENPPGVMPGTIDNEAAYRALNRAVAKLNSKVKTARKVSGWNRTPAKSRHAVDQWHHLLRSVMQNDGEIGTIAVQGIADISYGRTTVARVQQQIADAIRNDPSGVYTQRFSRLATDEGIQPFANDYFEDVLALFQKPDGSISTRLVDMFFDADGIYKGWSREELLTAPDEVLAFDRVTAKDLRTIPDKERPMVMMPEFEGEQYIPYANTLPSLFSLDGLADRAYMWMGRQNARLSREPIFWGNVIALWRSAKPRRDQLARAISSARGETWEELDDKAQLANHKIASELVGKDVLDRAYSLSLAFMDNPMNRSNLAWKARNVSRYYRASEDFYRRMRRMGTSNPEGFVKAALVYSLLDDTGFVYTDDYGDKYFMYPMNGIAQKVMYPMVGLFKGQFDPFTQVEPFGLGGKVLGLTPSADPMNMIPPFTSGWGQVPAAAFFAWQPELGGLRALILGQFNQPTGSMWRDIGQALAPAGAKRLGDLTDTEQAQTAQADSLMKALQTMSGWGMFDTITMKDGTVIPLEEAEQGQIMASNEYQAAEIYSTGLWISKKFLSWALPAYPRRIDTNVSDWARQNGIDNMTDAFYDFTDTVIWDEEYLKLVEEAVGEDIYDPWNYAMASWWQLRVNRVLDGLDPTTEEGWDGGSFLPFTVGSFEDAGDTTQQRANFRAVEGTFPWYFDEENGYKSYPEEHQSASLFLAPREGEFDYTGHYIAKYYLATRTKKAFDDRVLSIVDSEFDAEISRMKYKFDKRERELDPYSPTYAEDKKLLNAERDETMEKFKTGRYSYRDGKSIRGEKLQALAEVENLLSWMRTEKYGTPQEPAALPEGSSEYFIQLSIDIHREAEQLLAVAPGNSRREVLMRNIVKKDRDEKYEAISIESPNAKNFIESVLWNL